MDNGGVSRGRSVAVGVSGRLKVTCDCNLHSYNSKTKDAIFTIFLNVEHNCLLEQIRHKANTYKSDKYDGMQSDLEKSRIRETKHLSTDADSSTDTTVGWTKNTQKPKYFEKRKKSSKTQKLKNV